MSTTNGNGNGNGERPNIAGLKKLSAALRSESGQAMFDLNSWFWSGMGMNDPRTAFASGGKCGTTACIQGMAAIIDKRWKIEGVKDCIPIASFYGSQFEEGFSKWARIPLDDADAICDPESGLGEGGRKTTAVEAAEMVDRYVANGCSFVGIVCGIEEEE